MTGLASITQAVRWQHFLALTRITVKTRLSYQTIFLVKLHSQARVGQERLATNLSWKQPAYLYLLHSPVRKSIQLRASSFELVYIRTVSNNTVAVCSITL